jgi:hypothetical protein
MSIQRNPYNDVDRNQKGSPFTAGSSWYKSYGWYLTERKTAYIDTEYDIKMKYNLPKEFMPYQYSYERRSQKKADGIGMESYGWGFCQYSPGSTASANLQLLNKVARNDFNLAVSLAEMGETVKLIASTAKRIAGSYSNLRKGNISGAFRALGLRDNMKLEGAKYKTVLDHKRSLYDRRRGTSVNKAASSQWLEMQYGWTPLLMDAYNAAEYAAALNTNTLFDVAFSAYDFGYVQPSNGYEDQVTIDSYTALVRREARYRVTNPTLRLASTLGLTNPLLVGWELVPFSFVVDWFAPVGDYLSASFADVGLEYVDGGFTSFTRYSADRYVPSPHATLDWSANGHIDFVSMTRSRAGAPTASFPPLSLFEAMNGKRFADSLALLRVVFGR